MRPQRHSRRVADQASGGGRRPCSRSSSSGEPADDRAVLSAPGARRVVRDLGERPHRLTRHGPQREEVEVLARVDEALRVGGRAHEADAQPQPHGDDDRDGRERGGEAECAGELVDALAHRGARLLERRARAGRLRQPGAQLVPDERDLLRLLARARQGLVDRHARRGERVGGGAQGRHEVVDPPAGIHPEADPQEDEDVGEQLPRATGGGVRIQLHGASPVG